MNDKKQIEEMAQAIGRNRSACMDFRCKECRVDGECLYQEIAEALYHEGYRKQKEGKWVFKEYSEDTYTNLTRIYECSLCGRTIECLNEADEPYCHCGARMKGGE